MTARAFRAHRLVQFALAALVAVGVSACHQGASALGASGAASANGLNPFAGSSSATSSSSSSGTSPTVKSTTLSWNAPTENSDGTPLTNLAGYTLHYGTSSLDYTGSIQITNPATTSYVVSSSNFPAGTFYFAISAYNAQQLSSPLSSEVVVTVN